MSTVLRFGAFEVDPHSGQLRKHRIRINLREQSFQVLESLLARPAQVVTREELCARLWPDEKSVDVDDNLNAVVARLREALGDSADRPRFVETVPRRGYRFIAEVSPFPARVHTRS